MARVCAVSNNQTTPPAAPALLHPSGARVIIGGTPPGVLAMPIVPSPTSMFAPRGVCLGTDRLLVCDTGHHRLLIWNRVPERDAAAADLVIGQPDFFSEGRNAHGMAGPATLNVPTGVAFGSGVLCVADAWNHRVLLWQGAPRRSNQPADVVLGQADFGSDSPNRGLADPRADTLHWCYGVAIADRRLFVADTGNRRVLVWNAIPAANGTPADLVLGQRDFVTRDESGGGDPAMGMRWPHAIVASDAGCFVADAGSSRIMAWRRLPTDNGRPCDYVLGHSGFGDGQHNRGANLPSAMSHNMPYGLTLLAGRLVVADTANSRLLGFDAAALGMGAAAAALAGQRRFDAKGENRWKPPERDSLCWPYGVAGNGEVLAVADTGNNRVLLWDKCCDEAQAAAW